MISSYLYPHTSKPIFQLFTLCVKNKWIMLGSTVDCHLFLYVEDKNGLKLMGNTQFPHFPVCTYYYEKKKDILYCGTVGGDLLVFETFSTQYLEKSFEIITDNPMVTKYCQCIFQRKNSVCALNYNKQIFVIEKTGNNYFKKLVMKIPHLVYLAFQFNSDYQGNQPNLLLYTDYKKPPFVVVDIELYETTLLKLKKEKEEDIAQLTEMTSIKNKILTGNMRGQIHVYQIVPFEDIFVLQLIYKMDFNKRILKLCAKTDALMVLTDDSIYQIGVQQRILRGKKLHNKTDTTQIYNLAGWLGDGSNFVIAQKPNVFIEDRNEPKPKIKIAKWSSS